MVNVTLTSLRDPLRDLAFSYAPADRRAGLEALFALDAALGQVLRTTSEPMVGQMRLAWWREALTALDTAPPPAEPVLQALTMHVLPAVSGDELAKMIDGWEPLLGGDFALASGAHAMFRGAWLFQLAGRVLGAAASDPVLRAGEIWALADLARHLSDAAAVAEVRTELAALMAAPSRASWSRNGRALGALELIARRDASGLGEKATVFRLLRLRLTGR